MAVSIKSNKPEHWLTMMNCYRCRRTPQESPVYKCHQGHTVCGPCYHREAKDRGNQTCPSCGESLYLKAVSEDFLRKLISTPGIGRACRYSSKTTRPHNLHSQFVSEQQQQQQQQHSLPPPPPPIDDDNVTLENIFQLPQDKICVLLAPTSMRRATSKEANCGGDQLVPVSSLDDIQSQDAVQLVSSTTTLALSKKPLKCPCGNCKKVVAMSSFENHFRFDHNDIPKYMMGRNTELHLILDSQAFEYGRSTCLGMISVYEVVAREGAEDGVWKQEADVCEPVPYYFWLMASGSREIVPERGYVVFWMFSYRDEEYHCTMELSSMKDVFVTSVYCTVNEVQNTQDIDTIAKGLNGLCVPYNVIQSMLIYGSTLNFRVIVH